MFGVNGQGHECMMSYVMMGSYQIIAFKCFAKEMLHVAAGSISTLNDATALTMTV